nr:squalene/phytoene synthase family protein [Lactiplantibacillus paraplantarum]
MTQTNLKFEQHRADFDYCQSITKQSSNAFYTAFSKLPQTRAWSIYAVYAFCRTADDLVDVHHDIAGLVALRRSLTDFAAGRIPNHPMWRALAVVFETYDRISMPFSTCLAVKNKTPTLHNRQRNEN